jgi:hypothetical protein
MDRNDCFVIEPAWQNMIGELTPDRFRPIEFQACTGKFGYGNTTSLNRHAGKRDSSRFAVLFYAEII